MRPGVFAKSHVKNEIFMLFSENLVIIVEKLVHLAGSPHGFSSKFTYSIFIVAILHR